jgi:hypothetical protein
VQQLFENAGRQPNETRSASFESFPGNVSASEADATWTWSVNITDVALPEDIASSGQHEINEQWQLQWPGGNSLESFMNRSGINGNPSVSLCLSAGVFTLPSNVTSSIADADQGNCSAIFGSECAEQIIQSSGFDTDCDLKSFRVPPQCMDTLGTATSFSWQGTSGMAKILHHS